MAFLVQITDINGNFLREVEVNLGGIVELQPSEERVVLPYVDPGVVETQIINGQIEISIGGQEPIVALLNGDAVPYIVLPIRKRRTAARLDRLGK